MSAILLASIPSFQERSECCLCFVFNFCYYCLCACVLAFLSSEGVRLGWALVCVFCRGIVSGALRSWDVRAVV